MPVACIGHWYVSLLYLAPVAIVVGALAIVSRLQKHREDAEESTPPAPAVPRAS
jgi:hypothetical protein